MEEHSNHYAEASIPQTMEGEADLEARDPESNSLNQPLLKRNRTLSSNPLALVGAKVSHIESLDYEWISNFLVSLQFPYSLSWFYIELKLVWCRINENDLFKHDWRSRSKVQVLQYILLKWTLALLVGLLTGLIATLINLAVENVAGYKLLAVVDFIDKDRFVAFPRLHI